MTVAYDGSGFRGFAAQRGQTTVAGSLAAALHAVVGHEVALTCAGRTDAGVHAAGQVVHFDVDPARARPQILGEGLDTAAIQRSCNRMLAPGIVVTEAAVAPPGFDARRSARWRRYRYLLLNREVPDPFLARTSWLVADELDLTAMQLSCDAVHGEHDFAAFCRRPPAPEATTVRRVLTAGWTRQPHIGPDVLAFEITATSFCHQMVRSLVGTMVDMGKGRLRAGEMAWILRAADRSLAGPPAPPHGLCLMEVGYPPEVLGSAR
ncbi:MAG TPA: tRNA pseudouridine(38-40) synthase TruA [Acidimicrobiales bacterium]|nr:tRNA pseudouridine(38-40) synthase TruA [Acidimicrobiales bacterium]